MPSSQPGSRPSMNVDAIPSGLEHAEILDRPAEILRNALAHIPDGAVQDALHGVPIGHPVHPLLVQVPIGTWVSATVLDFIPGTGPAATALIATGLAAAAPTAAAGAADWAATRPKQQRVGLVHAACNIAAVGLYGASLAARIRGRHGRGRALALAGLTAVGVGGFLGGHLSYRQATGANHADGVAAADDGEWHGLGALSDFDEGQPTMRMLGETPLVVVRHGADADVLAGRCSHLSGPLWDGDAADGCLTCPWHGSVFDAADGHVVHGPATAPQPAYDTRIDDGNLRVRLRDA
ncbi:Rieske 2Fe-2S domain-containing protein [Yinghuangia aomiensis]